MATSPTDEEIRQLARVVLDEGAPAALDLFIGWASEIARRHIARGIGNAADREDVLQNVLIDTRKIADFIVLQLHVTPAAVVASFTHHRILDWYRKSNQRRQLTHGRERTPEEQLVAPSMPDRIAEKDVIEKLRAALEPSLREVLDRLLQGTSQADIARDFRVNAGTVSRWVTEIIRTGQRLVTDDSNEASK